MSALLALAVLHLTSPPDGGEEADMGSALHCLGPLGAQRGRRIGNVDPHRTQGVDLEFRGVLTTRDHGAGMAHAASRWRGATGDEADHGLLGLAGLDELSALDLGVAADLADHDDALGLGIGD